MAEDQMTPWWPPSCRAHSLLRLVKAVTLPDERLITVSTETLTVLNHSVLTAQPPTLLVFFISDSRLK